MRKIPIPLLLLSLTTALPAVTPLSVSSNGRFLQSADGSPFFWLADTGWLLFRRLDRMEAERYLENRRDKGFNVVQVMALQAADVSNTYGKPALIDSDPTRPNVIADEYDYWDHVDWILNKAAEKGLYLAIVPAWGSVASSGALNTGNVEAYTRFLAERYRNKANVIWLVGGDTRGDRNTDVWRVMGQTLKKFDSNHLVTFHPFGRTQSSTWFHDEPWLDFNMFQSGHRRYDQDDSGSQPKGEDNWRYVEEDYGRKPPKPTIDGEPSYENIPQGLHDTTQPYWNDNDCRRYAYWSVFAGAFGHSYGNNAVMQMHKPDSGKGAYGPRNCWYEAIDDPGAGQMQHLKNLMLSRPFFERVPAQEIIAGEIESRYNRIIPTRGRDYLFIYSFTGHKFSLKMGMISGKTVKGWWFNPRDGNSAPAGTFPNNGTREFDPPCEQPAPGCDWVLVLDDASRNFTAPEKLD